MSTTALHWLSEPQLRAVYAELATVLRHVDALRAAGFTEIGTLWQRGADRLLCGVLGAGA